jgi:hypothetical protein
MAMQQFRIGAALAALILAGGAQAASEQEAARLGADLTPVGAEKAANKDGAIPAYAGSEAPTAGWSAGKNRAAHWKHKGDKPLYSIDISNVDKYADKLTPGQIALVKQSKGYRMDVYPTHRTCGNPEFVEANTKKNATTAKIGTDGWSLKEAVMPGIPFPVPKSGIEAIWNYKMKYAGIGFEWPTNYISLSPRKGSSEWIQAGATQTYYFPWGKKGSTPLSQLPPVEYYTYFAYQSPVALAGQALAIIFYTDKPGDTFYYFPGQRRVRRMPTYAYDAPQIGFENQYTMDEPRMFNGTPDRFDWKLVGKKEILVPYNAFGMYDPNAKPDEVLKADGIDPAARRYELHRVWVVEATAKAGVRHVAPKRAYYLDEDSWSISVAEDYDAQGKLWKVRESFVIPVYETGGCDNPAFVQYNLTEGGRYVFDQSPLGAGKDMRWVVESNDAKFKENFYTSDNLRAISER